MTRDKHPSLQHLTAQYRAVRAPASLTHNTLAAAAAEPVPRRWSLALASASLLAVAVVVLMRQSPQPAPLRSAGLPSLPALGSRLAIIKPPALGQTPSGALPSLPAMPAVPATPPTIAKHSLRRITS